MTESLVGTNEGWLVDPSGHDELFLRGSAPDFLGPSNLTSGCHDSLKTAAEALIRMRRAVMAGIGVAPAVALHADHLFLHGHGVRAVILNTTQETL